MLEVRSRAPDLTSAITKFGFPALHPFQAKAIPRILAGEDLLVSARTGGGKSFCYQAPAYLDCSAVTIVISPLISLMHDQVVALREKNIPAAYLDHQQSSQDQRQVLTALTGGELKLLYVAPERLHNASLLRALAQVPVNRLVVDEAHCISQWGHSFRPAYKCIPQFRDLIRHPPLAAFTATLPRFIENDVLGALGISQSGAVRGEIRRDNFHLSIEACKSDRLKSIRLQELILDERKRPGTTLVYCAYTRVVERMAAEYSRRGISVAGYHGQMPREERQAAQDLFLRGKLKVMFATNAFGMGIDSGDVWRTIHFNIPGSIEAYYQEIGRAGRRGQSADAVLLFAHRDVDTQIRFLENANPTVADIERAYRILCHFGISEGTTSGIPRIGLTSDFLPNQFGRSHGDHATFEACLNILERQGYLVRQRMAVSMIMPPWMLPHTGLTLDHDDIALNRRSEVFRLHQMIQYAQAPAGTDLWQPMERYFATPTIPEELQPLTFRTTSVNTRQLELLQILLKEDLPRSRLKAAMKKGSESPTLALLSPSEKAAEIAAATKAGLIVQHGSVGSETHFISEAGIQFLKDAGITIHSPSTYDELKTVMHSPLARPILHRILSKWYEANEAGRWRTDPYCAEVLQFRRRTFDCFGTEVTGEALARNWFHLRKGLEMDDVLARRFLVEVSK